jgi:hypothetical protein
VMVPTRSATSVRITGPLSSLPVEGSVTAAPSSVVRQPIQYTEQRSAARKGAVVRGRGSWVAAGAEAILSALGDDAEAIATLRDRKVVA